MSDSEDDSSGILPIEPRNLHFDLNAIYNNMKRNYYWSDNWSCEFYIQLAYHGFVSVSQQAYLIPEIQKAYGVVDWKDLHTSKNVKKRAKFFDIAVNENLEEIFEGLDKHHKSNWVQELFRKLYGKKEWPVPGADQKVKFLPHCVAVKSKDGTLVAGEIGYSIGKTYTSLTGFFDTTKCDGSETKLKYTSAGKVQLIALGKLLEAHGYSFWNLGHPYDETKQNIRSSMIYKKEIGAHIESRKDFLERWIPAVRDQPKTFLKLAPTPAAQLVGLTSVAEPKSSAQPKPMEVEKQIDFNELSVKELKALLIEKKIDFSDCLEKSDLVNRLSQNK